MAAIRPPTASPARILAVAALMALSQKISPTFSWMSSSATISMQRSALEA
jgi:hypothetical protein